MTIDWWHWAILGIVFLVSEMLIPAFVLVWFGLGAMVVSLITLIDSTIGLAMQLLIWVAVSLFLVFLWFRVFKQMPFLTLSGRASAEAVGETGILVSDVDSYLKGYVRFQLPLLGSEVWECIADEPIKTGERVVVESVDGHLLRIVKAENKEGEE